MSDNKGKRVNKTVANQEIDDYAQALLDKRTEMALLKDMPKIKETKNSEDREQVEQTFSSALDMLRKERGQKTIEEEEIEFEKEHPIDTLAQLEEEDFTTSSLENEELMNRSLSSVRQIISEPKEDVKEDPVEKKEDLPNEEKKPIDPKKKKKRIFIGVIVAIFLLLMGGYAYKMYVYDPQNVISEAQAQAYRKLQDYADEFGDDMLSEAEKLEILDLKKEYDSLLEKQKKSINEYFEEQIGKSYTSVYKEMKQLKEEQENDNNPDYQEIVAYLNDYGNKDENEKMNILNLKPKYDVLSSSLQKKVDSLCREKTSKSFIPLYNDFEQLKARHEAEAAQKAEQEKNSQIANYQVLIDETNSELQNYMAYKSSLEQELLAAQQAGQDTSEIQSQIDMNDQLIAQCNANIQSYQASIDALK